jgi:hypothetical protein
MGRMECCRRNLKSPGGRNESERAAEMIINLYKLVAKPGLLSVGPYRSDLAYVTLKAYQGDRPPRRLRVHEKQIHQVPNVLADQGTAVAMMKSLRDGFEIEVPGLYTGCQLVKMGFRKASGD